MNGELDCYRQQLLELRDRLSASIGRMSEVVLTDDQPLGEHDRKVSEDAGKETVLERSEEAIRQQVADSLQRIDRGTYGLCQECGGAIEAERLEAIPYTPFCVGCEDKAEAGGFDRLRSRV